MNAQSFNNASKLSGYHRDINFNCLRMTLSSLFLLILIASLVTSCNKDDLPERVTIKGTISYGISNHKAGLKLASQAASLSDAQKVVLFYSSGDYDIYNIENGSFAASGYEGTATALAFVGANNSFIGCLQAGGVNVLPLVSLRDGDKTVIDLSTLTLEGTNVIPANNPIGNEIHLNEEEIERFRQFGAYFESLSKNIDTDGDGKADILDDKEVLVSTIHQIYCGKWGLNNVAPQIIGESSFYVNYNIRVWVGRAINPQSSAQWNLTGPESSPYNYIEQSHYHEAQNGFIAYFRRPGMAPAPPGMPYSSVFLPFKNGTYKIAISNKQYSFNYSTVDAKYLFVLAIPTIHTNDKNEITSISVEYKDLNGRPVNAENFVYQTMIQLNKGNNQLEQIGVIWEPPHYKKNTELYNFVPTKKILVSDVDRLNVVYVDLVGNSYYCDFRK